MSKQYSPAEPKKAHSTSPSVSAEGAAQLPVWCLPSCGTASRTTRSHATAPVRLSTASRVYCSVRDADSVPTKRRVRRVNRPSRVPLSPTGTAVVTNTWSPQMIGVADPLPGIAIFQRTLSVSLHFSGGSASGAAPVASGPRHCGQVPSAAVSPALEEAAGSSPASIHITTIRDPCTHIGNPCLMPIPNRLHRVDAAARIVDPLAEF